MAEKSRKVQGEIILADVELPATPADVNVYVEDVSRADAPSVVVGHQRQTGVSLRPGSRLPFAVDIPAELIHERNLYSIRVHIDTSRSGEIKKGDLISMQTYPVLTRGYGDSATVNVKRV